MKKFKFYVLTSNWLKHLKRHTSPDWAGIPKEDLVVVINTQSSEYIPIAVEYCEDEGIEYHITESNGTPAKGKNSVIDLFLESDNDYMVMIDGDDYLTPHGVWLYNQVAQMDNPPDAISLVNQWSAHLSKKLAMEKYGKNGERWPGEDEWPRHYVNGFKITNWGELDKRNSALALNMQLRMNVPYDKARAYQRYMKDYYRYQRLYSEPSEIHSRVTWLSRKAVENHRFSEDLVIGEDTLFYYHLKHDGINKKLDFKVNNEYPATYIYDETTAGIVNLHSHQGTNFDWMGKYNEEVKRLSSKKMLHANTPMPLLEIEYPEDYVANDLGATIKDENV